MGKYARSVKLTAKSEKVDMGGIMIDQPLPINMLRQIDPFILIHHWKGTSPGNQQQRDLGVGPHPHAGFSPVTVIFKGEIHHRDSLGNSQIVSEGGVQWMNAGKGITHSERPSASFASTGGEEEFIQFWVNSPASEKRNPAYYMPLERAQMHHFKTADEKSTIQLIAGTYRGETSRIKTSSELLILRLDMSTDAEAEIPIPENYNAILYVLGGEIQISDGRIAGPKEMIWFENDGKVVSFRSNSSVKALLLSGMPINEPLVQYGPFVLNTQTEIMQAIRDSQMGKMGILIEEFNDH